ncbi:MAG: TetR/AcrR family transcriptional regulator [Solirubrobacteraceae bacterium]|nr:TetR/AcrR family transcriptional regulator [Solirubrobacteraceae bacterium]
MSEPATDHRRAIAERNAAAIVAAAEQMMSERAPLSVSAVAARAGVSRVTFYAHFAGLPELVAAVVRRTLDDAVAAMAVARPDEGPALEAFARLIDAGWRQLERFGGVGDAAAEHVPPEELRTSHERVLGVVRALVERGRAAGEIRDDLPAEWLVTTFYALLHAGADDVRAGRLDPEAAPAVLRTTILDLLRAR